MCTDTDIELINKVKSGDETAFSELMRRYYRGVLNYIYRFTNNRETSEDLAQEVFLRVYRSVKRYKPDAKFSTWLYKIATKGRENNISLDELYQSTGEVQDQSGQSAYDVVFRKQIKDLIFDALTSLPPRERMAIILCKYEELPYDEVAEIIGCTPGAVKAYVHRGRMKLIEKLKPCLRKEVKGP